MKAAIVVTSIHDCTALIDGYLKNFAKYGRQAVIYLIPDMKTPSFDLPRGVAIPGTIAQVDFLRRIGFEEIPFNSDNRRNVGYLMALEAGAEVIISIDDDNYCPENEDFIGEHSIVLQARGEGSQISTRSGWYNNCSSICPPGIYPRGLPYYARQVTGNRLRSEECPVRINAGLWTGDPDLDAITWMALPATKSKDCKSNVVLALDTWCPINSQNTAVAREMLAAYWFVRMQPPMDRFGDIFQGYFALKVAKHLGYAARFGSPVVRHIRNSHVYMQDIAKEIGPILMIEELLPKLIEHKLTGSSVVEAYLSLAGFIEAQNTPIYLAMARAMRLWAATCQRLLGG